MGRIPVLKIHTSLPVIRRPRPSSSSSGLRRRRHPRSSSPSSLTRTSLRLALPDHSTLHHRIRHFPTIRLLLLFAGAATAAAAAAAATHRCRIISQGQGLSYGTYVDLACSFFSFFSFFFFFLPLPPSPPPPPPPPSPPPPFPPFPSGRRPRDRPVGPRNRCPLRAIHIPIPITDSFPLRWPCHCPASSSTFVPSFLQPPPTPFPDHLPSFHPSGRRRHTYLPLTFTRSLRSPRSFLLDESRPRVENLLSPPHPTLQSSEAIDDTYLPRCVPSMLDTRRDRAIVVR